MELPDMGKHCAQDNCHQLDFLPLQCRCGKIFCSEHLNIHVQSCVESRDLTKEELKKIEHVFLCSKTGCNNKSVVPLICQRCNKHYCIQHRHLTECEEKSREQIEKQKERYAIPLRKFNQAKAIVDKEIEINLAQAKKKQKNKEMAARVQLMKIKNKATGVKSIPSTDRLYFNITHPKNHEKSDKISPVFVSKSWSLGRAIDAIANECKIVNNNNKSTEKKLRLFKKDDNNIVSDNLSVVLASLVIEKVVVDGEDLVIEYVDDDCISL